MIKSMTGFAETEVTTEAFTAAIEIKGYNSRYLDIAIRIPNPYVVLEEKVRHFVSQHITRGRVEIKIAMTPATENTDAFEVNESLAAAYYEALVRLKNRVDPAMDIPLSLVAEKTGIIELETVETDMEAAWATVQECLTRAISDFNTMKTVEGDAISDDLKKRLSFIGDCINRIEKNTKNLLTLYHERLNERINELTRGIVDLDPARIAQEAAFLADKSDISEEVVRAKSHLAQFLGLMEADGPSGRPLNFLLQEFNREFNTMGSKAGDAELSHLIVSVKTEIEKIREQIQNVE